ncbi:MAG: carboxypeptidase regulatory-like domain-containing protein [Methylococcaceae bacterium]
MNRTATILLSLSIAAVSILFAGCDSKKIEGQVNDPFGKPLAGANIQVELTQFAATSEADGRFILDYAPGQFTVKISKTGYTTQNIPLSIQQKTKLPLQPAVLYPIPETEGMFLLSESGLQRVSDDCKVSVSTQKIGGGWEGQTLWTFSVNAQNGLKSDFPKWGELTFIDRVSAHIEPVKLRRDDETESGVALQFARTDYFGKNEDKYSGFLKEKTATVGQEQLQIRTITTDRNGRYAWVAVHQEIIVDDRWILTPNKPCFYFAAGAQSKDDQKPIESPVPPPPISQQERTETAQIPAPESAVSHAPTPQVPDPTSPLHIVAQPSVTRESVQVPHQELKVKTEDQQTIQAPTVPIHKQGDSYTLESINLDNGTHNSTTERKVVLANAEKVVVESRNVASKSAAVRQLEFTPEWNVVATRNADGSGLNYSPPLKYYEFPLTPGKTWQQTSIETNTKTGATREHTLSATVVDWETVTVPAGTFRSVKVTIQTELLDRTTGQKTTGTDTSWYVPEVRRSVRSLTSSRSFEGIESKQDIQLIKYNLTK